MSDDVGQLFSSISCAVLSAGHYAFPPNWHLPRSAVPHYRLFVALEGRASFMVNGERYALSAGGVLLVPPQIAHEARQDQSAPLTAYVIDFDARLHGILDVAAVCGLPISITPTATRRPKIAESAHAVVRHLTYLIPGYQLAIHTHCVRLLDLLWKEALSHRREPAGVATRTRAGELLRFRPVFQLVEARFGERLTLQDLAGSVHLHPAYFSAFFKRTAGLGPHEYLARYRLERARDLLVASDYALDEIARRTGFCDAAHLIRVFRRFEGISPGRYRSRTKNVQFGTNSVQPS
jgi:AraC family transcriptional regulator, arabinose operon regulatory protein